MQFPNPRAIAARTATFCTFALFALACASTMAQQSIDVAPDSPRWEFEGQARATEYLGRRCVMLDGGGAGVKDLQLRDGVIDVDAATSAPRGFFGIQFRIAPDGENAEWIYLRQHKSGLPDAMQYTPVLKTGAQWQIFSGPGFTGAVDIPRERWFHLRLEMTGAQAKLYVEDMTKPALVMDDLKSGLQSGDVALVSLTGATCFSNFRATPMPDSAWVRHLPAMPVGTIVNWQLSPSLDALARNLELAPVASELDAMQWLAVQAEPPGFVVINRYLKAPHPRVTFQGDWSKRLDLQPGTRVVYARAHIHSDRDEVRKLALGYTDEVSVFLNGRILWRGRSAQGFRDPGFLGIMDAENDAVYLPLKKGDNELLLAVSELGGGWGFVARLQDAPR